MDWNWFFSSIAQSMAAIVGIFSAFIITKVVNNQNEFARKHDRLRELLSVSERLREGFSKRYISWLTSKRLDSAFSRLDYRLEKGEKKSAEEFYADIGFPMFASRKDVLEKIQLAIESHIPKDERPSRPTSALANIGLIRSEGQIQRDFQRTQDEKAELDAEEELINNLITETKHHIRLSNLHLLSVENNPESSLLITISIIGAAILFFLGVIYPLSFLPTGTDLPGLSFGAFFSILFSFKGIMLCLPTIIFVGILATFAITNLRMKYDTNDVKNLREATVLGNYSEYLQIVEANKAELTSNR